MARRAWLKQSFSKRTSELMGQMEIWPKDAKKMTDEQLMEIVGVGPATLREIRSL